MLPEAAVIDLGHIPFDEALRTQESRVDDVLGGAPNTLFFAEHPSVITLGRSANPANLLLSAEDVLGKDIAIRRISRGGDITCHFPGQLVVYPIWRIERRSGGLKAFVHDMEETVLILLQEYGISGHRRDGLPGVWTMQGKIASIGLSVRRWVTYHGLSLNVSGDLGLFQSINPCGIAGQTMTSLHLELPQDAAPTMEQVKHDYERIFLHVFAHTEMAARETAG